MILRLFGALLVVIAMSWVLPAAAEDSGCEIVVTKSTANKTWQLALSSSKLTSEDKVQAKFGWVVAPVARPPLDITKMLKGMARWLAGKDLTSPGKQYKGPWPTFPEPRGKVEVVYLVQRPDGTTFCSGHEVLGEEKGEGKR